MTPVNIRITCGKHKSKITILNNVEGIGIKVDVDGWEDVPESYAVWNVTSIVLSSLGISQEEVDQRMAGLQ